MASKAFAAAVTTEPTPLASPQAPPPHSDRRLPEPLAEPPMGRPPTSATNVSAALQVISAYIPTEILTLDIAVLAALRDPVTHQASQASVTTSFWVFLAARPAHGLAHLRREAQERERGPDAVAPGGLADLGDDGGDHRLRRVGAGAARHSLRRRHARDDGVVMLTTSTLLGLAAPVFQRPLGTWGPGDFVRIR